MFAATSALLACSPSSATGTSGATGWSAGTGAGSVGGSGSGGSYVLPVAGTSGAGGGGTNGATPSGVGAVMDAGGGEGGFGDGGVVIAGAGGGAGVGGAAAGDGGAAAGDSGGGGGAGGGTGPTFHAFLLLGQSNMAGYPKAQAADKVEDPRIEVLGYDDCAATGRQQDEWDVAAPPLHECWNGAIGPGDYFAKTLIDKLPPGDTIGLVPCAISGEKIETFLKSGGTKYTWIVERAKLAQQARGVIEGILFHQGESNNGDPNWPGKVNTLVTDLRTDLALGNVPFLAGELAYDGGCAGHNTLVNQLPSVVANAYVVSAQGLKLDPADTQWHLHFDRDSQVEFGKRYEAKMIEALQW